MGIDGLNAYIKKMGCITYYHVDQLKGLRVAIDAYCVIYTEYFVVSKYSKEVDSAVVLKNIINRVAEKFRKVGATPVFIFDGKHPREKSFAFQRRNSSEDINNEIFGYVWNGLLAAGYPCMRALEEGDELCAALWREGFVSTVYTKDSDLLTQGVGIVCYKEENSPDVLRCYELNTLLNILGVTFQQFVDVCIYSGCDFNEKSKGIGFATALKKIKEYGSLDNIFPSPQSTARFLPSADHRGCRVLFTPRPVRDCLVSEFLIEMRS